MRDPYVDMIGKRIEVKEIDGQVSRGVLHSISYTYISLRHPWVVITRRNIANIKEIGDDRGDREVPDHAVGEARA